MFFFAKTSVVEVDDVKTARAMNAEFSVQSVRSSRTARSKADRHVV